MRTDPERVSLTCRGRPQLQKAWLKNREFELHEPLDARAVVTHPSPLPVQASHAPAPPVLKHWMQVISSRMVREPEQLNATLSGTPSSRAINLCEVMLLPITTVSPVLPEKLMILVLELGGMRLGGPGEKNPPVGS